jgi:hypothetical protein
MGTTTPPYDIRVWLYPGANPAGTPTDWGVPLDVSAYVRQPGDDGGSALSYTVGRQDEASQVDASTLDLTLDNRSGMFSTKNVASPLYGKLRRNTPLVMGMTTGFDSFNRTAAAPGTSDSGQTYASNASWATTGAALTYTAATAGTAGTLVMAGSGSADYDGTFQTTAPAAVSTGAVCLVAGLQYENANSYLLFKVNFDLGGALNASMQRVQTGNSDSSTPVAVGTYTAGSVWNVRFQRTGRDLRIKVWAAAGAEPATWTTTWVDDYVKPGDLGLFGWRLPGNTNAGSVVFTFDALNLIGLEFIGNVVQWPVRWNKRSTNSWAPIQAAGILRRLQQGKGPIRSPLTRQLGAYAPTGWWTLEDSNGADSFASQLGGVPPAYMNGVLPAGDSTLPGAGPAPTLSATNGIIRGSTRGRVKSPVKGFSAMFFTNLASGVPTTITRMASISSTGAAVRWDISLTFSSPVTLLTVEAKDSDGTVLSSNFSTMSIDPTRGWVAWQLETDVVGANTSWSCIYHLVGAADYYASTGSHASTASSSATGFVLGGTNYPVGTGFSQMWLGPNTLPFVAASFSLVSNGYAGELAADRLTRLCFEEGIPFSLEAGVTDPVGTQPQTNILQALRNAADADMGILYERGSGLGYRPRSARYSQSVDLALTVAAGQIDDPPEPIDDDQRYRNKWTITNDEGSYAVAQDDVEIASSGLYEDAATLTLFSDDYAAYQAGFRLYLGTWPDLRWPGLSLDFARNPGLIPGWRKRRYGFRLQVATGLPQVLGADPDVIVEGYSATLHPYGWTVTLNCSTATAWDIGTLDDGLTRADADNSVLANAVATVTAGVITTDNGGDPGNTWAPTSTMPGEVPFNVLVNGEVMTVINVGDIFSTTKQNLTVMRGINGGAKTHAAAEQVTLAKSAYVAM